MKSDGRARIQRRRLLAPEDNRKNDPFWSLCAGHRGALRHQQLVAVSSLLQRENLGADIISSAEEH